MRCVLLCVLGAAGRAGRDAPRAALYLEAVEDRFCLLEVSEVMCCVLLCVLGAVEGGFRLLETMEAG